MKVAIYARVSTIDQHPENQLISLMERVKKEGWKYELFKEKESTRKTRPIKYELYKRLLKKEFDAVIVWKLDRWARSMRELINDITTLYERGVKFISIRENIDLSTPEGKLQFHIISAFAEFERELISARTKEGLQRAVREGKTIGRPKGRKDSKSVNRPKSAYYQGWLKRKNQFERKD